MLCVHLYARVSESIADSKPNMIRVNQNGDYFPEASVGGLDVRARWRRDLVGSLDREIADVDDSLVDLAEAEAVFSSLNQEIEDLRLLKQRTLRETRRKTRESIERDAMERLLPSVSLEPRTDKVRQVGSVARSLAEETRDAMRSAPGKNGLEFDTLRGWQTEIRDWTRSVRDPRTADHGLAQVAGRLEAINEHADSLVPDISTGAAPRSDIDEAQSRLSVLGESM